MKTKPQIRHGTVRRYVDSGDLIVVLEVPVIYAPESPDEPLLEAKTLRLLDEVQRHADARDRRWLSRHGRVYESQPA